ncbi:hypothetical protein HNQ64_000990 [Prosthecobacter dejongeii]|uniref:Uncharacterized protein n=1 Tax=Prosthecobacter dejongeii TaxID=48465 RepID=A0A7W8DPB7_9BACT|nr:hypothetical protein [Prosthecobacter dejongeii]
MQIQVGDADLARCLASKDLLLHAYGAEKGVVLMRRLSELRALKCLGDLRFLSHVRTRESGKAGAKQVAVSVHDGLSLVIQTVQDEIENNKPDWATVTEITILKITSSKSAPRLTKT